MRAVSLIFLVLLLAAIGIMYYRGWFNVSAQRAGTNDQKVEVRLQIDPGKASSDTKAITQKFKEFGTSVKPNAEAATAVKTETGTVIEVQELAGNFTFAIDGGKQLTVQVETSAELRLGDKRILLKDLQAGDRVTVVYTAEGGMNRARSVNVKRAA